MQLTLLFILPLLCAVTAFSPTVTVTCAIGPTYTATLTGGSTTGVIFVDGNCAAQSTTATSSHTFDAAACTDGSVPTLGTEFKLVVQEYSTINLASDYIVKVTCTLDTSSVTQTVNVGATGEDFDTTDGTPTVSPTFSIDFQDGSSSTITSGAVGDSVQIALSIPSAEAAVFDYQVTTMTVTAGSDSAEIITNKCTQFSSILSQPSAQSGGALTLAFSLFIPKDTSTSPSLPGTSSTTVTYSFTIEVCDSACTSPTCSKRKRRSVSSSNSTLVESVEVATSLVVYPPGHKSLTTRVQSQDKDDDVNVCLSQSPLIGVLVALSVTLAVCAGITAWMFCRLRRPTSKKTMSTFSNQGFKA